MILFHIYYLPFTKLFNSRAFFSSLLFITTIFFFFFLFLRKIYYNYLLLFLQLSKKEKKKSARKEKPLETLRLNNSRIIKIAIILPFYYGWNVRKISYRYTNQNNNTNVPPWEQFQVILVCFRHFRFKDEARCLSEGERSKIQIRIYLVLRNY